MDGGKDQPNDRSDQLLWKWMPGAATTREELGDPTTADDYAVCLYDADLTPDGLSRLTLTAGTDGKARIRAGRHSTRCASAPRSA